VIDQSGAGHVSKKDFERLLARFGVQLSTNTFLSFCRLLGKVRVLLMTSQTEEAEQLTFQDFRLVMIAVIKERVFSPERSIDALRVELLKADLTGKQVVTSGQLGSLLSSL